MNNQQKRIQFHVTVEDPYKFCNEITKRLNQPSNQKLKREIFIDHFYDNEKYDLLNQDLWFRRRLLSKRDDIGFPLKQFSFKLVTKNKHELIVQEARNEDVLKIFKSAGADFESLFPNKYIYYTCSVNFYLIFFALFPSDLLLFFIYLFYFLFFKENLLGRTK